jgi:phosphatidylglycerophosphate synthase
MANNTWKTIEKIPGVVDYYFHRGRRPVTTSISKLLVFLHINPSHLTVFRFLLLVAFPPLWINNHYNIAVSFLAANILLDIVDGDLARILNTDSDKRKFEDVMVDNIMVIVLPLALIWQGIISGFLGGYYIFIATLSWWLSVVKRNLVSKSGWLFRAQASFLLFVARFCVITFLIFTYVLFGWDIFTATIITLSAILTLSSFYDYYRIVRVRREVKS